MTVEFDKRSLYREHVLSYRSQIQDDGRYQARVAITSVGSNAANFSQRFLDLEICDTAELALEKARLGGIAWVDQEYASRLGARLPIG